LRAKELQAGGTADIEGPCPGVEHSAMPDDDFTRTTLYLKPGGLGETLFAPQFARGNDSAMTANQIDGLPAPTRNAAVTDREILQARKLDAVEVSARTDVFHGDAGQDDVMGWRVVGTAVVDVDAVGGATTDAYVADYQVIAITHVPTFLAAGKLRRRILLRAFDDDWLIFRAMEIGHVNARAVISRFDANVRARLGPGNGIAKRFV